MQRIRDIFEKKIDRSIEEVIKVDQHNEEVVLSEISEYIVTDSIKEHFITLYKEIAEAPSEPREGIGVWISGFFGSGKSSFAKILGYTVSARKVGGNSAAEIFKRTVGDAKVSDLLDSITSRIPIHAVIFDVSMDRGVRWANERMTEIMYKAILHELDYAEDFDLAELEITLEGDEKLEDFIGRFKKIHGSEWKKRRKLGFGINEASRVLNDMDPKTYPTADSYAVSVGKGRADMDANKLAARAFELAARRAPSKALIFIIDEVGQYVSRSVDKMLDLQGVVQAFGKEGLNRIKAKKSVAPAWIVVTSQEKLNEVVDALDSKKIELARLQDRFRILVDLKQSDISEVTGRRVLAKNEAGRKLLGKLHADNEGRIKTFCSLERTSRKTEIRKEDFIGLYPYLPYQIELCIDIVAGLRLKRGAHRHIGGSNRTIIKQAQEMMIHPRTRLADAPLGTLVTLDKVYELLYLGNLLPSEMTREIDALPGRIPNNEMALRVARALALLESVADLPRTAHNIAVVLHPSVESESILKQVEAALGALEKAKIVRETEEGYKLLTAQEINWDIKRGELDPKERDRNQIKRDLIREIFSDPSIRNYRYKNLRPFKCSLFVDGETVDDGGDIPLNISIADDPEARDALCREAREESNAKREEIFWIVAGSEEIHDLIKEFYRSQEMISTHERMGAQGSLTAEEVSCLAEEKTRRDRCQRNMRSKIAEALQAGTGFFRGVQHDGSALGKELPEVVHGMLDRVIPDLYPKLELGIRPLKGDEPEKMLTAVNLNALPPVCYDGENGLSLVIKQGKKLVPNPGAEICKELLEYVRKEHSYGNKVTGKSLETHFGGFGYGWDHEILRLGLAVLLRSGSIEVTHQGRKYRDHGDPACRPPFVNTPAFRSSSFAPREALGLPMLADASRQYEELTGREVDIEEGAIAQAFQKLAEEDLKELIPLAERMKNIELPGAVPIREHLHTVEGILEMPAEDCVKTLAGEGKSYRDMRGRVSRLIKATTADNISIINRARTVMKEQWPPLEAHGIDGALTDKARGLDAALKADDFYDKIESMRLAAEDIAEKYFDLYRALHQKRADLYGKALEGIKGLPEWGELCKSTSVAEGQRNSAIAPLAERATHECDAGGGNSVCSACKATIAQMEMDIGVVDAVRAGVASTVQVLAAPEEKIERVRVSSLITGKLETAEDVDEALKDLKEHILKLFAGGAKVILE